VPGALHVFNKHLLSESEVICGLAGQAFDKDPAKLELTTLLTELQHPVMSAELPSVLRVKKSIFHQPLGCGGWGSA
jgi:hypothetical protein